ncbi:MAG: riboflavin kinase, partial [Rhodoferax sp.]|nr:riboflavin kinase [Rhodoferax sp.]
RGLLVESFLIDWSGDLYGKTVEIQFLRRLRGEKRFEGAEPLIEQMHLDVAQAQEICAAQPRLRS